MWTKSGSLQAREASRSSPELVYKLNAVNNLLPPQSITKIIIKPAVENHISFRFFMNSPDSESLNRAITNLTLTPVVVRVDELFVFIRFAERLEQSTKLFRALCNVSPLVGLIMGEIILAINIYESINSPQDTILQSMMSAFPSPIFAYVPRALPVPAIIADELLPVHDSRPIPSLDLRLRVLEASQSNAEKLAEIGFSDDCIPFPYKCSLTGKIMTNPVYIGDSLNPRGIFEKQMLIAYLNKKKCHPVRRTPLNNTCLVVDDIPLKKEIADFVMRCQNPVKSLEFPIEGVD